MISHELQTIWITSDGKKFLTEDEAKRHEEIVKRETEDPEAKHRLRYDDSR